MIDIKDTCVAQLEDVLTAVEKAMRDIKAGDYDKASETLQQLKTDYAHKQQNQKVS
jgi:predicted DNA-binding protein